MVDYSKKELEAALAQAGIEAGDTVMFHTGLAFLGWPEGVESQDDLNQFFCECCREYLGEKGTILIPTYTYSFCQGQDFDPQQTPSSIGPFSEYFRKLPGSFRSVEPILSVCGIGPDSERLLSALPRKSFGQGCLYDRMVQKKVKICTVGLQMNWATFLHHIEEMESVPYRYRKYFYGGIIGHDRTRIPCAWEYSVRLWSRQALVDGKKLAWAVVDDGVSRTAKLGRSSIYCVRADEYYGYIQGKIKANPWFCAKGPAGDPVAMEKERSPHADLFAGAPTPKRLSDLLPLLSGKRLYPVSDAYDAALGYIKKFVPLTSHFFQTGEKVYGLLVPERWECRSFNTSPASHEVAEAGPVGTPFALMGSKSFEGEVTRSDLARHLYAVEEAFRVQANTLSLAGADWGIGCTEEFARSLHETGLHVAIHSDFSFGRMEVVEFRDGIDDHKPSVLVYARLANNGLDSSAPFATLVCAAMIQLLRGAPATNIRLLIVPDELGLLAWLSRYQEVALSAVIELRLLPTAGDIILRPQELLGTHLRQGLARTASARGNVPAHDFEDNSRLTIPYFIATRTEMKITPDTKASEQSVDAVAKRTLLVLASIF